MLRAAMIRVLDVLSVGLIVLIGVMILTGGWKVPLHHATLEMSQINGWVGLLIILSGIRFAIARKPLAQTPIAKGLSGITEFLTTRPKPRSILLWSGLALILFFTVIHTLRYLSFHVSLYDLGVIHQTLYQSWAGALFSCDSCVNGSFLSEHLAFIFFPLFPIAGLFKSHEVFFLIQSLAVFAGVVWFLWKGPLRTEAKLWPFALFVIVCHPAVRNSLVWDFREDHLAFLALSFAAVAAYHKQLSALFVFSILGMLCKENIAFLLPALYLAYALKHRPGPRQLAWLCAMTIVCATWVIISFKIFFPHFNGGLTGGHELVKRMPGLGSSAGDVLSKLVTHPWLIIQLILANLFKKTGIHYLLAVLGPWLFFVWRGWVWLIPTFAGMLMNLLSASEAQRSLQFHYELAFLPFLLLALLEGMKGRNTRQLALGLLFAFLFAGRSPILHLREFWPASGDIARARWLEEIPRGPEISSNKRIFAQLSLRTNLNFFVIPQKLSWEDFWRANQLPMSILTKNSSTDAEWIILDLRDPAESQLAQQTQPDWRIRSRSPDGALLLLAKDSK